MFEDLNLLDAISSFAISLDKHYISSNDFFSKDLLSLLSEHLKCQNACITAYSNGNFVGGASMGPTEPLIQEYYSGFYKRDVMSLYITKNTDKLLRQPSPIMRATSLISPNEYDRSEYLRFLSKAGFRYNAVLIFKDFRFTVFKHQDESDFSEKELDMLASLYKILSSKYNLFLKRKEQAVVEQAKSMLLDEVNCGYMIFNDHSNILAYNDSALYYSYLLFGKRDLSAVFGDIVNLLGQDKPSVNRKYKGYSISLNHISVLNCYHQLKLFYYVSIVNADQKNGQKISQEELELFDSLTAREKEVLDAFCNGSDPKEVATNFYISENTVRSHLKHIYQKLQVNNQRVLTKMYDQYLLHMND